MCFMSRIKIGSKNPKTNGKSYKEPRVLFKNAEVTQGHLDAYRNRGQRRVQSERVHPSHRLFSSRPPEPPEPWRQEGGA